MPSNNSDNKVTTEKNKKVVTSDKIQTLVALTKRP